MSENSIINSRHFSNLQESSYQPVRGRVRGQIIWPKDVPLAINGRIPLDLGLHGDTLIINFGDFLEARDRNNGGLLWSRDVNPNVDFDLSGRGIMALNNSGIYEQIGYDGVVRQRVTLPNLFGQTVLKIAWGDTEEVKYVYQTGMVHAHGPTEKSMPPQFGFARFLPKEEDFVLLAQREGQLVAACLNRDLSTLYCATSSRLYWISTNADSEEQMQSRNFDEILAMSLNHEGEILLIDSTADGVILKNLGVDGVERWQVALPKDGAINQPPASTPAGHIYVLSANQLLRITGGKIEWSKLINVSGHALMMTVLGDGSVVVVGGNVIQHVSSTGQDILTRSLPIAMSCRPIMDERGHLYIAGQSGIYCLE